MLPDINMNKFKTLETPDSPEKGFNTTNDNAF